MPKNSTLRVISGQFKGHILHSPEITGTHPMGAREKLALFNMADPKGKKVLDLYAGSGALGIEAISRGATEVVFVEKSPKVAKNILENLHRLGLVASEMALRGEISFNGCNIRVLVEDAQKTALRSEYKGYFSLILADPPYNGFQDEKSLQEALASLSEPLAQDGQLILSSPAAFEPPIIRGTTIIKTRSYAGARLTVYMTN